MKFKKTFWMNVFFAIVWALFCWLSYAIDIDYVERTTTYKLISAFIHLIILFVPIITAILLCKPINPFMRKLALFGNYCCSIVIIFFMLVVVYKKQSAVISIDNLFVFLFLFVVLTPFLINLKAVKAS